MKTKYSISRAPSGIFYLWYYDSRGKRQNISTGCRLKGKAEEFAVRFLRGEVASKSKGNIRTVAEFKDEGQHRGIEETDFWASSTRCMIWRAMQEEKKTLTGILGMAPNVMRNRYVNIYPEEWKLIRILPLY